MNPQRTAYLQDEMDRMVSKFHSGQQFGSAAKFAIAFVDDLIERLIREANNRACANLFVKIKRTELPFPYNEPIYVRNAILSPNLDINQEDDTIEQIAEHFKQSLYDNVLIDAIERLEKNIQRVGYETAVDKVGLLLGLITTTDKPVSQAQLTHRNGRIICKLGESVDTKRLERVLPHLFVIDKAIGKKGMADAVAKYLRNRDELMSGDVVNHEGAVCIEVFKCHLNVCFYRSTFDDLYKFLKKHESPSCLTKSIELAA